MWREFKKKENYFCVILLVAADHINTDIRTAVYTTAVIFIFERI